MDDATGFAIVWFVYETRAIAGTSPDRMTSDEARRMARAFARLPQLLTRP